MKSLEPAPGSHWVAPLSALIEVWCHAQQPHWIAVRGNSMYPLLRDGDAVLVEHAPPTVRAGDVVVAVTDVGLVVHRVLRALPNGALLTRGDNTPAADPPTAHTALLGRVSRLRRGERIFKLDTPIWRCVGRAIALALRAEGRLRRLVHPHQRRNSGPVL
jgi:signal peptidase I